MGVSAVDSSSIVDTACSETTSHADSETHSPSLSPKLLDMIRDAMKHARSSEGQDIIALIGNTGVGKSTAVNNLTGSDVEWDPVKQVMRVIGPEIAVVGHELGQSKTLYTNVYSSHPILGTTSIFADCGGFLDTRIGEQDGKIPYEIPVALSLKYTLENAKSVKLAICVDARLILLNNSVHFSETLEKVFTELLKDYKSVPKATMLMLTKPPVFEDQRTKIPYTRESAIRNITWLRDSLEDGDLRKELLSHVLREDGKYVAIYDPMVEKTKAHVLKIFKEMGGIQQPKGFFAVPYCAEVKLKLKKMMTDIAVEGMNFYQDFFQHLRKIKTADKSLDEMKKRLNKVFDNIEKVGEGEKDPKKIKATAQSVILDKEKEITKLKDLLDDYTNKENIIQSKIKSFEEELTAIDKDGEGTGFYRSYDCNEKARIININTVEETDGGFHFGIPSFGPFPGIKFGYSDKKKITKQGVDKREIDRQFRYDGPPEIAYVELSPLATATNKDGNKYWSKLSSEDPAGKISFSAHYQTGKGETGCAEIKIFIQKKNHPKILIKKIQVNKKINAQRDELLKINGEKMKVQSDIAEANAIVVAKKYVVDKLNQYEGNAREIEEDIGKFDERKSKALSGKEEIISHLNGIEEKLEFFREYFSLSDDQELKQDPVIKQFVTLDQQFNPYKKEKMG